ncbi:Pol protein [Phytophthora palmivora]|uniref:Pol protein n=1 Tax=Phytophthora palmivora TaxID=4796 RepID=A0A2P4YRC4_9STRA|nr:Pol protein [Phytophthora palmivora]
MGYDTPGAANLAGRHCGLHRKWERGPESIFLPSLGDRARVFEKTVVIIYRQQADANQPDTKNPPMNLVSSVGSNKLKHRFIGPFAVLARHGAAYTIELPKSMATHPTFYVGRLKRYHDPLGLPSRTEKGQGESSPPRNEAESSGRPELPVSKPVNETQAGTHASHTRASTEFLQVGSRNSAVNTPMELTGLTTKTVQILTKDL